ncbi:MAG TPA: PAS domain S-box protein [Gemmatimonadaceae bacterium]
MDQPPSIEATEALHAAIVRSAGDAIYAADLDGSVISWNAGAEALFGYSAAEMIGRPAATLDPPESRREHAAPVRDGPGAGPVRRLEVMRRRKDGAVIPVEITIAPLTDADGRVIGESTIARDITERRRAGQALAASEARFRSYFELPLAGIAVSSAKREWIEVNDRLCEMLGYSREELLQLPWTAVTHPDDVAFNIASLERVLAGEIDSYTLDKRFIRKDGSVVWASLAARVIRRPDGSFDSLCSIIQDVSERRAAELRVRYLNRVYAVLSDTNQMIVRERDAQAMLDAVCRIAVERGDFRMAWIGMLEDDAPLLRPAASAGFVDGYLDFVNIDLRDDVRSSGPSAQAIFSGEHRICADIAHDPAFRPWAAEALRRGYRSSGSFPLKVDGRVVGVFNLYADELGVFGEEEMALLDKLALDIGFALELDRREAERRRAVDALRDSEQRFRELAEHIDEVFWILDPVANRVLYVNRAFEQVWGLSSNEAYHNPNHWRDSIVPEDRERVLREFAAFATRGEYNITYRIRRPDGAVRWVHDRGLPLRDADGVVYRIVGTARDITEQRNLEAQLRQSQKMEAVGQLAGGIAHDFNNILAAVILETDLAAARDDLPADVRHAIGEIRSSADRAAALTRQLLAFSQHQVLQPRRLDLNETVSNLVSMLRRIVGEDVSVQLALHRTPLDVWADPGMLEQVLLNLVVNARDAMAGGGRLRIETGVETVAPDGADPGPALSPGRYARLTVADTGRGIAPDVLPRIFEPFFTTKEPGRGTGLGLATVFGIVKQHGGAVTAASRVGEGTTFRILFPIMEAADAAAAAAAAETEPRGGTETILLVEDESMVRDLTRTAFERAGYTVLQAANGVRALEVWEQHRREIGLLMTDLVMPGGVSGRDLAQRLQADEPGLKVLFTSGYSAEIAGCDPPLVDGENFLQKPYRLNRLLELARRRLG